MIIKRIKIRNYKTYLDLDLDLSVKADQPIILVGGMNGGGKTTLFEAICGALYGLKIQSKAHFQELLNNGALGKVEPTIRAWCWDRRRSICCDAPTSSTPPTSLWRACC